MLAKISKLIEKLGSQIGRFLSSFPSVLVSLLVYFIFSLITYVWLAIEFKNKAFLITYEVATGGSPFTYSEDLMQFKWLWYWLLIFRFLCWLVVPVLAATAVSSAYISWAERKSLLDQRLSERMTEIINIFGGLKLEEASELAIKAKTQMEKELNKSE